MNEIKPEQPKEKSWEQIQNEIVEEMENPERLLKLIESDEEVFEKIGVVIGLMTIKMEKESIQPVEFLYRICHKCYELGKEEKELADEMGLTKQQVDMLKENPLNPMHPERGPK